MAQAIAERELERRDLPAVVISAGTLGITGREPAQAARAALGEIDLDLEGKRSQGVSPALAERADFLPVMEPEHAEYLRDRVDGAEEKIVRLWQYVDDELDGIEDPVGRDLDAFRTTRDLLYETIDNWLDELEQST